MPVTLAELATWINGTIEGDETITIAGLAKIEEAQSDHLTFITNPKYAKFIETTQAAAVLVDMDFPRGSKTLMRVSDPYFAFLTIAKRFYKLEPQIPKGAHPSAIIGDHTPIGDNISIGPNVVIGNHCNIGNGTVIHPGVVLGDHVSIGQNCILYANVAVANRCIVGENVIIHMGAVIGSDGFGFVFQNDKYHKLPQVGIVVIEDDVEIGANTAIDRASLGETRILRGVKLDNLIHVAHNVEIGDHTAIAAQTGISGSVKIGKYVKVGGQAGFVGHIMVGDYSTVGAQGGVTKSVPPKTFVTGFPARSHMKVKLAEASLSRLPDLLKKVRKLEEQVKLLSQKLADRIE